MSSSDSAVLFQYYGMHKNSSATSAKFVVRGSSISKHERHEMLQFGNYVFRRFFDRSFKQEKEWFVLILTLLLVQE
jgi:hypothetical protein